MCVDVARRARLLLAGVASLTVLSTAIQMAFGVVDRARTLMLALHGGRSTLVLSQRSTMLMCGIAQTAVRTVSRQHLSWCLRHQTLLVAFYVARLVITVKSRRYLSVVEQQKDGM